MSAPRIVPTGVLGGIAGKDGSNVLPTDTAIKQAIQDPASQTAAALTTSIDAAVAPLASQVAPPVQTRSTAAMTQTLTTLAAVRAGLADARWIFIGDSVTSAIGATRATSLVTGVVNRLAAMSALAHRGFDICPSPDTSVDPRFTVGSGWAISGGVGPAGGSYYGATGASGSLTFAADFECDTVDIWLLHRAGGGTVQPKVKGNNWGAAIDTSVGSGWTKTTRNGFTSAPDNTFTLTGPTGGDVYFLGFDAYHSTQRRVRIGNWGFPGSSSQGWASVASSTDSFYFYGPDLTFIMLGINDANPGNPSSPVTTSAFYSAMDTLVSISKIGGRDVVLMTPPQPSPSSGIQATVEGYNAQIFALAAAKDCPVIDLYTRFGVHGTNPDGLWADNLHLTAKGYARAARLVYEGIAAL